MAKIGHRTITEQDVIDALRENDDLLTPSILKTHMRKRGGNCHYMTAQNRLKELALKGMLLKGGYKTEKKYSVEWYRYNDKYRPIEAG